MSLSSNPMKILVMQNNRRIKRDVSGILILDKPMGASSNAVLQTVKHLYKAKKAGHTGSLDPLASGMLPICFGEATKFSQFLLNSDKAYWVQAKLGVRTSTSDAEGEVVNERVVPALTQHQLTVALQAFQGETEQVPSMFSALKFNGQPLYKLARQGIEVDRPARRIFVYAIDFIHYEKQILTFKLHCSKGTYVRTIVDDLGEALQCGAHVISLRRTTVGAFETGCMQDLTVLESLCHSDADDMSALDQILLPVSAAIEHFPILILSESMASLVRQGQPVFLPDAPVNGFVTLKTQSRVLIGVGEMTDDGRVAPKRLCQSRQVF